MSVAFSILIPTTILSSTAAISQDKLDSKPVLVHENEYDNSNIEIKVGEVITTEPITTTSVIETTTLTTTIPPITTTTTEDIYKDIRFLEYVDNNDCNLEELNDFIIKYSALSKYSYYEALELIKNNLDSISSDYISIKGGIMCTLFESASDANLLRGYCSYDIIEQREMSLEEQEQIMLEMCDNLNLSKDEKLIVLAVFRHETGNGTSRRCVSDNNYGGIRLSSGEYAIYQTPEYGIYRTVMCIRRHINNQKNNGYTSLDSIVSGMSYSYCPATAIEWTNKILEFVGYASTDYNNFENGNVYKKEYE